MGVSKSSYCGPFVQCKKSTIIKKVKKRTCTNLECREHKREVWDQVTKFCSKCGSPINECEFEIETTNGNIWEELNERLYCPGTIENGFDIWFPNLAIPGITRRRRHYDEEGGVQVIGPDQVREETGAFLKFHANDLPIFIKEYGEENVAVHWGHVTYWS